MRWSKVKFANWSIFTTVKTLCKFLHVDTDAVEQREVKVGERRHFIKLDVAIALDACGASAGDALRSGEQKERHRHSYTFSL